MNDENTQINQPDSSPPEEVPIQPTDIAESQPHQASSLTDDEESELIQVEAEPSTTASSVTDPVEQSALTPIVIGTPKKPFGKRKLAILIAAIVLVPSIAFTAWYFLKGDTPTETQVATTGTSSDNQTQTTKPKLGIAVTVVDGSAEYQRAKDAQTAPNTGNAHWHPLTAETDLSEGDIVRTGVDGRVVLTLDDGSAARLDNATTLTLTSLAADDVKLTQTAGTVYSRVVTSDRKYSVVIDKTTYQAMGTAFATIKTASENGVQVYQSAVKAGKQTVDQGKQYYHLNPDATIEGKVTDLNLEVLAESKFLEWNLTQDEKDTKFKEKLGVLTDIKQKAAEKAEEKKQDETRKAQAEKEAAEKAANEKQAKAAEEKKKKENNSTAQQKITRGTMNLSVNGNTFSWSYTGKAVHGYKLVFSQTNTNPTFNGNGTYALYFSGINEMTGTIPGKEKIGSGTFYVRVCAYTNGTENEPCVDYSPVVKIVVQ